jgi:hypothetical protein
MRSNKEIEMESKKKEQILGKEYRDKKNPQSLQKIGIVRCE